MRHQKKGKLFGRSSNARKALARGLITALVLEEKVKTTKSKAKFLKRIVEKMINSATKNPALTRQRLFSWVPNSKVVNKIINEILPVLPKEKYGIVTLAQIGSRVGDQAQMVQVSWKKIREMMEKKEKKSRNKQLEEGVSK